MENSKSLLALAHRMPRAPVTTSSLIPSVFCRLFCPRRSPWLDCSRPHRLLCRNPPLLPPLDTLLVTPSTFNVTPSPGTLFPADSCFPLPFPRCSKIKSVAFFKQNSGEFLTRHGYALFFVVSCSYCYEMASWKASVGKG